MADEDKRLHCSRCGRFDRQQIYRNDPRNASRPRTRNAADVVTQRIHLNEWSPPQVRRGASAAVRPTCGELPLWDSKAEADLRKTSLPLSAVSSHSRALSH